MGCADRSCFDLNCHMKHSGANLYAQETLSEPVSFVAFLLENCTESLNGISWLASVRFYKVTLSVARVLKYFLT